MSKWRSFRSINIKEKYLAGERNFPQERKTVVFHEPSSPFTTFMFEYFISQNNKEENSALVSGVVEILWPLN